MTSTVTKPKPAAATEQPEFDFGTNLPIGMESFSVRWLAKWFRTTPQHWINLIEKQHIKAVDLRTPGVSKSLLRIPRAELIKYLNEKIQ